MPTVLEREIKYDVPRGASVPNLTSLAGVARVAAEPPTVLFATYYDTADLALARAGVTLRRRTGGEDAGWHLKLPRGAARLEMQLPDAAGGPPHELREAVDQLVQDQPLAAVAHIKTTRTVQRLLGADDVLLAELCDDQVAAARSGQPRVLRWHEWELELKAGGEELAAAAEAPLLAAGAARSRSRSKLVRTLRFRSAEAH